jgi:hypothetical protein
MARYIGTFVIALIVGAYLGASFSDPLADALQRVHVPLIPHHSIM